ncbi:MAG: DNA mismatch repair endonuclease MutL [Candidatus Lokiarchaeota archaeon]|nr:DNA mismatch repair endonuclease MutL [Candidatus Lokiarchaeota archaeon]
MSRVRVLDDALVTLIAAGEVIEHPASVVKELIENALDAGATHVDVEIQAGGIDSIKVSDNGSGILSEDVPICILRHSTSKISDRADLDSIATYGFRGEALATMTAVADVKIVTRHKTEDIGSQLIARTGEKPVVHSSNRSAGTLVEVTNLFSQVPARRKHLDSEKVEGQRVHEVIMKHAIVRNDIGFRLVRDDIVVLDCPEDQSSRERVALLWGSDIAKNLVEVNHRESDISIAGFIVRPPVSRGNRGREYFSVLKRPIEDQRLSKAVESAYSTLLMSSRFPICCLDISPPISHVDANVHPAKREVRIQNIDELVSTVRRAVKLALDLETPPEVTDTLDAFVDEDIMPYQRESQFSESSDRYEETLVEQQSFGEIAPAADILHLEEVGGVFRIIGQIMKVYLLLEFDEALVIIDQHAAHERVLYENLRKQVNEGETVVQELLEPIVLHLDANDAERILELAGVLENIGYSVSSFGGNEILVSSLPEILGKRANEDELISLVDRILDIGEDVTEKFMDDLLRVTACHSAIRAGQTLSNSEIRKLLLDLSKTPNRYNCAHGRPTILRIEREELDRRFGRIGVAYFKRYKARHRIEDDSEY